MLPGHEAVKVTFMGWNGVKNGRLLQLAADAGLDLFLTMDDGVEYQQNLRTLPIAVLIIKARSNDIDDLVPAVPVILDALTRVEPRTISRVG